MQDFRFGLLLFSMQALLSARKSTSDAPRPVAGWSLPVALELDEAAPGFMRWLMRSSNLRRQLFALVAAEILDHGAGDVAARLDVEGVAHEALANVLTSWPAQKIVGTALGSVPDFYIGALSKSGESPLTKPDGYRFLHALLMGGGSERVAVVKQATSVSYAMIRHLLDLDPLLCKAGFVHKLGGSGQVEAANHIVKLAKKFADADDARIVSSAADQEDISQWATKWIERMERFPHHLPELGVEFTVLESAAQVREAARRYRNCGKTRLPHIVLGREIIVEHESHEVLVVLTALTEGHYLLDSLWGAGNQRPARDVAKEIVTQLRALGILVHAGRLQPSVSYSTLRLVGAWEEHRRFFDADDEDDDEAEAA